jgi:PadR family transcriptional regulator PadR
MNATSIGFSAEPDAGGERRHRPNEGREKEGQEEEAKVRLGKEAIGDRATNDRRSLLQHFEFAAINAISTLGHSAFPAEITRFLSKSLEKHVSLAQVFIALERLEDKGFVSSEDSKPDPVRGGRRRRIFQVEESGLQAIRKTAATFGLTSSSGQPRKVLSDVAARRPQEPSPA